MEHHGKVVAWRVTWRIPRTDGGYNKPISSDAVQYLYATGLSGFNLAFASQELESVVVKIGNSALNCTT